MPVVDVGREGVLGVHSVEGDRGFLLKGLREDGGVNINEKKLEKAKRAENKGDN